MKLKPNKISYFFKQADLDSLNLTIKEHELELNDLELYWKIEEEQVEIFTTSRISKYNQLLNYLKGKKRANSNFNFYPNYPILLDEFFFNIDRDTKILRVQQLLNLLIAYKNAPFSAFHKTKIFQLERSILTCLPIDERQIIYDSGEIETVLGQIDVYLRGVAIHQDLKYLKSSRKYLLKNVRLKALLTDRRKAFRSIIQHFFKNLDDTHNDSFIVLKTKKIKAVFGNIKYYLNGQKVGHRSFKWHFT